MGHHKQPRACSLRIPVLKIAGPKLQNSEFAGAISPPPPRIHRTRMAQLSVHDAVLSEDDISIKKVCETIAKLLNVVDKTDKKALTRSTTRLPCAKCKVTSNCRTHRN